MLKVRRTITFRQVLITLCILLLANICVNVFTAASYPTHKKSAPANSTSFRLDPQEQPDNYDDEMAENMKAYQIDLLDDGADVWCGTRYVGFLPYKGNEKCLFHLMMVHDNE